MNNMSKVIKAHNKKSHRSHVTKQQNIIAEKNQNGQRKRTIKLIM